MPNDGFNILFSLNNFDCEKSSRDWTFKSKYDISNFQFFVNTRHFHHAIVKSSLKKNNDTALKFSPIIS